MTHIEKKLSAQYMSTIKDTVTSVLIPKEVSECSLVRDGSYRGTCLSDKAVDYLATKMGITTKGMSDEETISMIHKRYGTKDDKALIENLPENMVSEEVLNLKIPGPKGTELLSNNDIDGILKQWEAAFDDFFAYNFNMLDYTSYSFKDGRVRNEPDTLATIDPLVLFEKYKMSACIINSDKYHGGGKHWMALFVDNRSGSPTAEFFNSSGRGPVPEWISYLQRVQQSLDRLNAADIAAGKKEPCKIINNHLVQQHSMTECGVYSLFYVWARLNNLSYGYFDTHQVYDTLMFEFRAHLYDGYDAGGKWSFDEFKKSAKVKWDHPDGHREGEV